MLLQALASCLGSDTAQVSESLGDGLGEKSSPAEATKTLLKGHSQGKPAEITWEVPQTHTHTPNTDYFLPNFLLPVPSVSSSSSTVPDSW